MSVYRRSEWQRRACENLYRCSTQYREHCEWLAPAGRLYCQLDGNVVHRREGEANRLSFSPMDYIIDQ